MEESLGNCHDGAAVGLLCHSGDLNAAYASQEQHVRSPGPISARHLEVEKTLILQGENKKKYDYCLTLDTEAAVAIDPSQLSGSTSSGLVPGCRG